MGNNIQVIFKEQAVAARFGRGVKGSGWLSGAVPPSDSQGQDGDYYFDTAAVAYYGPKADGTWTGTGPVTFAPWPNADGAALADANRLAVGQLSGAVWTWVAKTGTQVKAWLKTYFDTLYSTLNHTQAATTLTLTATDKLVGRQSAGAGAAEELACTSLARAILARATAALMRGDLAAYRAQAVASPANVGGAVTLAFASALILPVTLTSNWTSSNEPTGLADGETALAFAVLSGYALYAKPANTATAVYLSWTVTGPTGVRISIQRVGTVYYWSAVSW